MSREDFYKRLLPGVFFLAVAADILGAFRFPNALPAFYSDDFFYYLKVAESIATRHLSTFDGSTLTNGYHPLWMVTLVGLLMLFNGKALFLALGVITTGAVMALFFLSRTLCQIYKASPPVSTLTSLLVCLWAEKLMKTGMEIIIAIPLLFAVAIYVSRADFRWATRQCLMYGFLSSLAILARLDVALFLVVLLSFQVLATRRDGPAQWLRRGVLFAAGGFVLPVYLGMNYLYFGALTPISSVAKHLKPGIAPSLIPAATLVRGMLPAEHYGTWLFVFPLFISFLGLLVLIDQLSSRHGSFSPLMMASLLFPFFHIGILSMLSDWPLWPWYFYPLALSCTFSLILFAGTSTSRRTFALNPWVQSATAILLLTGMAGRIVYRAIHPTAGFNPMYEAALNIVAFDKDHHGKYAMGDRAGTVGYLLPDPLIQLEGLVMDKAYLKNVCARRNLIDVLRDYHVNYYVSTNPELTGSCYRFVEPAKAGPASPKMHGELCEQPLMMVAHNGFTTAIFALQP